MDADSIVFLTASERPIDVAALLRLYESTPWAQGRDPAGVEAAVAASIAAGAWDGERLVGFARALSDGKYRAYVEDVVVDPEYRAAGVGVRLVAALLDALGPVAIVSLFCEPARVSFYERNGFQRSESQVMMHRESPAAAD